MSDVYFLFAPKANVIKIGVASDPHKRIRGLQTPEPCRLVGLMTGVGVEGKQALHGDFRALRTHGEWFLATTDLRSYIERHAEGVPDNPWTPVQKPPRRQRRRGVSPQPHAQRHHQAGAKRRNRANDAASDDRIFFVYECYNEAGQFLYVAKSIEPSTHWAERVKHSHESWAHTVTRFVVRGPYTKSVASRLYSEAVLRDPVHVGSAPTAKSVVAARRRYFADALRVRMDAGETWEQAMYPAQQDADAIDFRALVEAQRKAAT